MSIFNSYIFRPFYGYRLTPLRPYTDTLHTQSEHLNTPSLRRPLLFFGLSSFRFCFFPVDSTYAHLYTRGMAKLKASSNLLIKITSLQHPVYRLLTYAEEKYRHDSLLKLTTTDSVLSSKHAESLIYLQFLERTLSKVI